MKALIAIALIVLLLVAVGVMHFSKSAEKVNVTIETRKIEDAAEKAVETGKKAIENASEKVKQTGEQLEQQRQPSKDAGTQNTPKPEPDDSSGTNH